ncbi:P-loop NTPase fold protein [Roseobacter litoralis]|uniref:P-loop NTPase fold protein n=1 Tax=Roseobacter litoralis TaxID=42443 RepID=UPI002493E9CA|nr:P-loop NTPase fold protein [Roseobacter litoralis]
MLNKSIDLNVVIGVPPGNAAIVFASTDVKGTPGELNQLVRKHVGAEIPLKAEILAEKGYQIVKIPDGPLIVWIVTVGGVRSTRTQLGRNLSAALKPALEEAKSLDLQYDLWVPLMGTGFGNLKYEDSAEEILNCIEATLSKDKYTRFTVTISLPPDSDEVLVGHVHALAANAGFGFDSELQGDLEEGVATIQDAHDGFGLDFQREPSEPLALDRDQFCLALARLFRIAKGEFSLALLGRWGSGKTTIADRVASYLEDETSYRSDFKSIFRVEPDLDESSNYEIVRFNAWRYRQRPELWIWLYESFVTTFLSCSLVGRLLRPIRAGIEKQGFLATVSFLLTLALVSLPLMWASLILPYGSAVFGLSSLIGLVFLARRWQASLRLLVDRYGLVATHREKLGMQALVGEDLKALVKSWTSPRQFSKGQMWFLSVVICLVSLAWFAALKGGKDSHLIFLLQEFSQELGIVQTTLSSPTAAFTASSIAWFVWSMIAFVFWIAVVTNYARTDRLLLVIDDLDRCPQEEIVDLIDGIKLMIDDKDVGKVVQAFVLADDTILQAAIQHRFDGLSNGAGASVDGGDRWRAAVREHMEKVFLCHISLPPLEASDVRLLIDAFGKKFDGSSDDGDQEPEGMLQDRKKIDMTEQEAAQLGVEDKSGSAKDINLPSSRSGGTSSATFRSIDEISNTSEEKAPNLDVSTVLSSKELSAIHSALVDVFDEDPMAPVITPRTVRSFLFKYQLARMLLQAKQSPFEVQKLAQMLASAILSKKSGHQDLRASNDTDEDVSWVVRLVA